MVAMLSRCCLGSIVVCLLSHVSISSEQVLDGPRLQGQGLCGTRVCRNLTQFKSLAGCVVIVGNLVIFSEKSKARDFTDLSFPDLREVTGYMMVYRVNGLRSLGQLFPNLTLVRGQQLVRNYALGIHSMPDLIEIGLYSLLRIERGGVVVWDCPRACFVRTVDWDSVAPRGKQIIAESSAFCEGPEACRCMNFPDTDYCWNRRKCQRLLAGPVAERCHEQCLGCRKTDPNKCSRCAHYTDDHVCVSECPYNKIVLPQSRHCLTRQECYGMFDGKGWVYNETCVAHCPDGYNFSRTNETSQNGTCIKVEASYMNRVCPQLNITSLYIAESFSHCTNISGSLTIRLHSSPHSMEDLRRYLGGIVYIRDYLLVTYSVGITSLDFLINLKTIAGISLFKGKYAIVIREMKNLRRLFPEKQTKELKILNGSMLAYNNALLCLSEIENFHRHIAWPMGYMVDISSTSNGHFGQCYNIEIPLNITATGQRSAIGYFKHIYPERNLNMAFNYSYHYVELSPGSDAESVSLYCNSRSWVTVEANLHNPSVEFINITKLEPSTTYALYVEAYQDSTIMLKNENLTDKGRSRIENFTTEVGIPPPPFIVEIASLSPYSFALNWIDHMKYSTHITRYLLDFSIINYDSNKINSKDQCREAFTLTERYAGDYRHVIVRKPPVEYGEICVCRNGVHFRKDSSFEFKPYRSKMFYSLTPILSSDHFDVCEASDIDCHESWEAQLLPNQTVDGVIQSLGVELLAPRNQYVARGLLPFHDYKLRLRACTGPLETDCGRSVRETIRTQMIPENDIVHLRNITLEKSYFSLFWDPPIAPNGYTLAYVVQWKPFQSEIVESCITRYQHEKNGRYFYLELKENNEEYSVRVCTSSMAADRACGTWFSRYASPKNTWVWWLAATLLFGAAATAVAVRWWRKQHSSEDWQLLIENIELSAVRTEPPSCEEQ